ncbi:hypothetical protein ABZW18_29625 [Streptomyces sp. NPDC004647]|uniref:hypothetical protein n=1 Tax=Streptomyces sp. NPDC004647 TaxID=3154671 RepID=UPI0033B1EFBD
MQLRPVAGRRRPLGGPEAEEPPSADAPIYTAMVERWTSAGRAVPGRYDNEWISLVRRPPWPGR